MSFAIRYFLFAICLCGCSGSTKINFISLNTTAIDPPRTEPWQFDAQECFWWLDDAGEFNLALQCRKSNLILGRLGDMEIDLTFALDGPPAGSGRDYPLRQREVRAVILSPAGNQRFNVHSGICSVLMGKGGTYRGSYRVWMTSIPEVNILSILPQRPGPVLCFGTFYAVRDEVRGREIRAKSESFGGVRPAKPATATQTASTTASGAKPK